MNTMISKDRVREARNRVERVIHDSCLNGRQSKVLPADQLACGQFIGEGARELEQKGLHGTAAALLVLARSNRENSQDAVARLVNWIKAYREENAEDVRDDKILQDRKNIIKTSEILFSLSNVGGGINVEDYKQQLAKTLINAKVERSGWSYFAGQGNSYEIIPTAYAVGALAHFGEVQELEYPVRSLADDLRADIEAEEQRNPADYSAYILILYVLSSLPKNIRDEYADACERAVAHYWDRLRSLFDSDLEQNIEYWHKETAENKYVRIPWQLYYVCASARIRPNFVFANFRANTRIENVVNKVLSNGFVYPHSGHLISSRTYSIIYDTLGCVEDNWSRSIRFLVPYYLGHVYHRYVKPITSSWLGKSVLIFLVVIFMIWSVYSAGESINMAASITAGIVATIIVTLLGFSD